MRSITSSSLKASAGPVDMCLPLRRMVRRSQNSRTSRMRCEMNTTVTPLALETLDDAAQPVHVAPGQRGRGLVQQQNARLAPQRPRDLDLLALRQLQRAGLGPQVHLERQAAQMCVHARRRAIMPSGPCGA